MIEMRILACPVRTIEDRIVFKTELSVIYILNVAMYIVFYM